MNLTFISAGAGSGKTHTLTHTLGELLQTGSVHPAGVLVTTFTRKAASELRERVRQHLLSEKAFTLANAMGQARIGTINSVCGELLERFAFEAGLPPQQQVIEEAQSRQLIRVSIDAAQSGDEVAELSRLAHRLGIEDWPAEIRLLIDQARANNLSPAAFEDFAKRNADDLLAHFPAPAKRDMDAAMRRALAEALPELSRAAEGSTVKKTRDAISALESFERDLHNGQLPWAAWVRLGKECVPEKSLAPLVEQVQAIAAECAAHPRLHQDLRDYLLRIFAMAGAALDVYQQRKRTLGVVDFTDQEHLLLGLLDNPVVSDVLREEIELLLVDEFQDTSPLQLAIFIKLAGLARQTYWVGDIKQAIYGFRGSDTALMEGVLKALHALGGEKTILSDSWRSRPALVQLVNAAFTPLFSGMMAADEIQLNPKRPELAGEPAFGNWFLEGRNAESIALSLAGAVQQLLQEKPAVAQGQGPQTRPLEPKDVAILCYTNHAVTQLAAQLTALGVPVSTAQPGLLRTAEAKLALAGLRRLNDAGDTLASAEIIALADSCDIEAWLPERLQTVASQQDSHSWRETGEDAHPLLARIAALRAERPLLTPAEAMRRIITVCELPEKVLGWQADPQRSQTRIANLDALLEMAACYEQQCEGNRQPASISGLLLWLAEQAGNEEDPLAEPALNAVRILTHHGAKGLEWPVVILADLDHALRDRLWGISAVSESAVNALEPLANRFIRYWPWPFGKQQTGLALFDEIAASPIAAQYRQAAVSEAQRLLYVSMTRARDRLIFARKAKAKQEPWLDTLSAPWLGDAGQETLAGARQEGMLALPEGGQLATCHLRVDATLQPLQASEQAEQTLHWFSNAAEQVRLPLWVAPSAERIEGACVLAHEKIADPFAVSGEPDWAQLGTAIHACLAASFTPGGGMLAFTEIEALLERFHVRQHVQPETLARQIGALQSWIESHAPGARVLTEIPVSAPLANGQICGGRIDMLLDTAEGYILIDHKLSANRKQTDAELAAAYGGQLAAYQDAIERASGRAVTEKWIFAVSSGRMLQIGQQVSQTV
ncbi:UvrD-helicase domain-containing protein [Crenobacter intestini]|uniref:DNA 3'-5' helicase n=1 Tax=Crenobacter intestini TaxID=2563443 RepID=A0A4T0UP75_9NEIS|nr:UvrD-helicase domain-containing protein [Crenobacter intestini]TIC80341.1 DNA helicase UvrD [Crenobacter intestini]